MCQLHPLMVLLVFFFFFPALKTKFSVTAAFIPVSTFSSLATLLKDPEVKINTYLRKCSRGRKLDLYQGKPFQLLILGQLNHYCVSKSPKKSKKTTGSIPRDWSLLILCAARADIDPCYRYRQPRITQHLKKTRGLRNI